VPSCSAWRTRTSCCEHGAVRPAVLPCPRPGHGKTGRCRACLARGPPPAI
jgi:hypothetical protein